MNEGSPMSRGAAAGAWLAGVVHGKAWLHVCCPACGEVIVAKVRLGEKKSSDTEEHRSYMSTKETERCPQCGVSLYVYVGVTARLKE